jgi:hypothetical protein
MTSRTATESWLSLVADLASAKALAWIARVGKDAALSPEADVYFADRYRRLARYHRAHGRTGKASRLEARAAAHWRAAGGDDPPYAAAMAIPRPRRWVVTDAVSRTRLDGPGDDAA